MRKWIVVIVLMVLSLAGAQTTPNLGLQLPNYQSPNWGVALNFNFSRLDGYLSAKYTLPALETYSLGIVPRTYAELPASPIQGEIAAVTDSTSSTTCSAGGGSNFVLCYYTGSVWTIFGGGGGSCSQGTCVVNNPTGSQVISQPASTTFSINSYDPQSTTPAGIQGAAVTTNMDWSTYQVNSGSGSEGTPGGLNLTTNYYGATNNTQNNFGGIPRYSYGAYLDGIYNVINRYNSGQTFGQWNVLNCHGAGDCIGRFDQIFADGGINGVDDEGVHYADSSVSEDPSVFTGTISAAVSPGATTIPVTASIGGGTQGKDRLLLDTVSGKEMTGAFDQSTFAATVNQVPFGISDPNANFPVSTFVSLCYAGSDNGAGGAAGCPTNGTAPSGYIPPQQTSPTQQQPATPIVTSVLDSYPGQPSYFCTNSTLQSSNSGAACYMPATGVGCLTDSVEYETVNYTYNSTTQQITLNNLNFSHLNGMVFATGGMCGFAVEPSNSIYSGGGTQGVQSQVFPIEGSPNSTTILDITQRTNEGYGSVGIGTSQNDWSFSTSASGFSSSGALVNITVNNPSTSPGNPSGSFPGCLTPLNLLTVTITTANSTYNGSYQLTQTGCNTFTYQPSPAVSGTQPTTGTVSFSNMQYTIFPSARVLSVYDTATKSVDGNMYTMPYPSSVVFAQNDTVREPHYQQMSITATGTPSNVTRFTREQYLGSNSGGTTFAGVMSGKQEGFAETNSFASTNYLGHGGTYPTTGMTAYGAYGLWSRDFDIGSAPDDTLFAVDAYKPDIGASSPFSNFGILEMTAPLPGAFAGYSVDDLLYDPAYKVSTRSNALTSGEFYCGQQPGGGVIPHNSVCTWEAGYFVADQSISAPSMQTSNVSATPLPNFQDNFSFTVGTTGSTGYNYEIVGRDANGHRTLPTYVGASPYSIPNGNATLNSTNYNVICAFLNPGTASYDFLKEVSGVYESMAVSVAVGNGASFNTVPNYTCYADQGGATSAYTVPTVNTTGSVEAATMIATVSSTTASLIDTSTTTVGDCLVVTTTQGNIGEAACGSGSGTVNSGTAGQYTYYAATGTAVSGNGHLSDTGSQINATEPINVSGTSQIVMNGSTSGTTALIPSAVAGGTVTLPDDTGTIALSNRVQQSAYTYAADTGAANAYAVTLTPTPSIAAGSYVVFKAANNNTGASTLAVNGGAATALDKNGANALVSGDVLAGAIYTAYYDGTEYQLLNPTSGGGGTTGAIIQNPTTTATNTIAPTSTTVIPLTLNPPTGSTVNSFQVNYGGGADVYVDQYGYLHNDSGNYDSAVNINLNSSSSVGIFANPNGGSTGDDVSLLAGYGGTSLATGTVVAMSTSAAHSVVACAASCTNAVGVVVANPNSNNEIMTVGSVTVNLASSSTFTPGEYVCSSATAGDALVQTSACPAGEQIGYTQAAGSAVTTATIYLMFGGTGASGSVTSVGLSMPSDYTVSGSPVTSSGTFSVVRNSETANEFLASPNGAAGVPTYRAIVAADVPTLNQNTTGTAANVTGVVAVANGGTGATTAGAALTNLGAAPIASPTFTGTVTAPTADVTGNLVLGTSGTDNYIQIEPSTSGGSLFNIDNTGSSLRISNGVPVGSSYPLTYSNVGLLTVPEISSTTSITTPLVLGSDAATISTLSGAGTGATAVCSTDAVCSGSNGEITLTTGTSPAAGGQVLITLASALPRYPNCVAQGVNSAAAALVVFFIQDNSTTLIDIDAANVPAASTIYQIAYVCGG